MSFTYKTEPFAHQRTYNERFNEMPACAVFAEQGTGKTKMLTDNAGHLHAAGHIDGVLVIAPSGVHLNWTREELPKHDSRNGVYLEWRANLSAKRRKALVEDATVHNKDRLVFLCMNIEALRTEDGVRCANAFLVSRKVLMAVDESTVIKGHKALQTKSATKLAALAKYRRIMTGTPVAKDPLDFFAQFQFLGKNILPWTSFTAFKNMFAVTVQQKAGNRSFERIVGFQNLPALMRAIAPYTFRVTKKECLDLPEKVYRKRFISLSPEQKQRYTELKRQGITVLTELERGGVVTADSVLAQFSKLRQVVLGFLKDDDGTIHRFPNPRMDALLEEVDAIDGKVVIFSTMVESVEGLVRELAGVYGPESVVHYYGGTSSQERADAVHRFQNDPKCRFFVANKTASMGLTLTAASHMIFYANGVEMDKRLQSEDRIHRSGQKNECTYTDFETPGTVDVRIREILEGKLSLNDTVMVRDWRQYLEVTEDEDL